jgi:hypothetical protein
MNSTPQLLELLLGSTSLPLLAVALILKGNLLPRKTHEEQIKDKEDQIKYLQIALNREIARNDELNRQNGRLMEVGRTTEHIVRSLPIAAVGSDSALDSASSQTTMS